MVVVKVGLASFVVLGRRGSRGGRRVRGLRPLLDRAACGHCCARCRSASFNLPPSLAAAAAGPCTRQASIPTQSRRLRWQQPRALVRPTVTAYCDDSRRSDGPVLPGCSSLGTFPVASSHSGSDGPAVTAAAFNPLPRGLTGLCWARIRCVAAALGPGLRPGPRPARRRQGPRRPAGEERSCGDSVK